MSARPALEITDLTVRYGDVTAVRNADLELSTGELRGLIGPNGSGKSSLFRAVLGMLTPENGTVRILGGTSERARRQGSLGYVPQRDQIDLSFPIPVAEVVAAGCYGRLPLTRRLDHAAREVVDGSLAAVGMTGSERRPIGRLSGGQRKRVMIARALASRPDLLLLDEPFAGVDRANETAIARIVADSADTGVATLVATHDLDLARKRRGRLTRRTPRCGARLRPRSAVRDRRARVRAARGLADRGATGFRRAA